MLTFVDTRTKGIPIKNQSHCSWLPFLLLLSFRTVYELKNMEFSVKDIAPGKLRVGNGDAVLHVLNILLDKVLTHRGWAFKPPEYPADNYDEDVEVSLPVLASQYI